MGFKPHPPPKPAQQATHDPPNPLFPAASVNHLGGTSQSLKRWACQVARPEQAEYTRASRRHRSHRIAVNRWEIITRAHDFHAVSPKTPHPKPTHCCHITEPSGKPPTKTLQWAAISSPTKDGLHNSCPTNAFGPQLRGENGRLASKRAILDTLTKTRLLELASQCGLDGLNAKRKAEVVDTLVRKRSLSIAEILPGFRRDELKAICQALNLDDSGRRKADLIERLQDGEVGKQHRSGKADRLPAADSHPKRSKKTDQGSEPMAKKQKKANSGKRPIEQYDHKDKSRANNPPVGLVTPHTDPDQPKKTYEYDPHLDPQLVWAGKAEHTSFEVPTASLHVHERIDPRTIIKAVRKRNGEKRPGLRQLSLFEEPDANPPLREAVEFYKHPHGWTNRLIAGDSLVVMNSLLEKEGMAGKVQMVYIDPPYGIRYGSNFQPFVNNRDVKDGADVDLTQEPEMIRAFRDTWELGVHSYLSYLRDRLLLARDLLAETGSIFVQIGDSNLHHVRELLDEVFGAANQVSTISFKTNSALGQSGIGEVFDYLVWYAKDRQKMKFRPLFRSQDISDDKEFRFIDDESTPLGYRRLSEEEFKALDSREYDKVFRRSSLTSSGYTATCQFDFDFSGAVCKAFGNKSWRTTREGIQKLVAHNRLFLLGTNPYYKQYYSDFPYLQLDNAWVDTVNTSGKLYVVQTSPKVAARCILMTTDPGDLVFDPTCGSGTTPYVAEQYGRRWVACDTSRVAVTLAKQRLTTATFDYYNLAHDEQGVSGGFAFKIAPHITLKSIAKNPDIHENMSVKAFQSALQKHSAEETLYDQPEVDNSKARVTGPFTLEAVPAPAVRPISELTSEPRPAPIDEQANLPGVASLDGQSKLEFTEDVSVARYGETARQRQWRDELLACGVRGKGGHRIEFVRIEPLGATRWLHCEGETKGDRVDRVVVSFGPEHAPLEQRQVELALEEAVSLKPTPKVVIFAAFQFDPEAAKDIDVTNWPGVTLLKVQMNTDLLTDDLKKKRSSNESYWLMGQPDVALRKIQRGEDKGLWEIEVHGFDYYNPRTGSIESGDTTKIAMWMLDTDYDGRSLYPRQVFFPMAGAKDGWARLAKNLKAEIDEDLIEAYRGTVSLPFEEGDYGRAAVKIVDDRGIESLKIVEMR